MKKNKYILSFVLLFTYISCTQLSPYVVDDDVIQNDTTVSASVLRLNMSTEALAFFKITPQTFESKEVEWIVDATAEWDDTVIEFSDVKLNLHGESSLKYIRKSLEVKVKENTKLFNYPDVITEFFLIAMEEDPGYFYNYAGYMFLEEINSFYSYFEYIKLYINGNYEGIYLLVEKTQNAIKKKVPGVEAVYRRDYGETFHAKYVADSITLNLDINNIYKYLRSYSGSELYSKLNSIFDIDGYLRILSLNFLLKNGDYLDEMFFYLSSYQKQYQITGWDYEDIFQPPHNGFSIENSLVYTGEDSLDIYIANDSILYSRYLEILDSTIDSIYTREVILDIKSKVEENLLPFFKEKKTTLIMSHFSEDPNTAYSSLKSLIDEKFNEILLHRDSINFILDNFN